MAAIDVHTFLENLKQLMSSDHDFVASQRDELQVVYKYINEMSMLLKSTEKEGSADMAMHIRDLVFEAESIVDLFIVDSVSSGGGGYCDLSAKLDSVKGEMDAIIKNSKDGKFELELWYSKADDCTTSHVVGLRPQIDKIMSRLKHGKSLEIISIVGLPGTGKTTLAKQIYNDHCTKFFFEIQAWIKVCKVYRKRDFLTFILESFNLIFKEEGDSDEEALGGLLHEHLQSHKYLIVMDDLLTAQVLFDLQTYLPDQCNGSKIIVTTHEAMVAKEIQKQDYYESCAIRLGPLSEEDSLELFQRKLLEEQTVVSKELKEFGMLIVKQCHGLPFAIAVISRVLARKAETPSLWGSTANILAIFRESYKETLICRYNQLPPHLKACLLYIGSFPEDYSIPVRELVWLLIAEGFGFPEEAVGIVAPSPEVVAEGYISALVDRCLVEVLEKEICGSTKTCRIVSLMREFCSAKVQESKFAYQARSSSATQSDPRRLFISRLADDRISLEDSMQSLRSLLCFGIGGGRYKANFGRIFSRNDLKLVKVLDLLSIPIDHRDEIGVMVHLTYLAVGCEVVPQSITNLFNLETLILSNSPVVYLPHVMLKMDKLRRVINKAGALCFSRGGWFANSGFAANLQTVYPLCCCWYCKQILKKSPRIRNLGLSAYGFYLNLDNLCFIEDLETLKCIYSFRSGSKFIKLPSSIKRLTLKSTFLQWKDISPLGTLPNLEVLKLLENACAGEEEESCWDTSGQGFPRLKCLKMRGLNISQWVGNDVQFMSLEVLSIAGCERLRTLPSSLARAPFLHTLEVKSCNGYVKDFFDSIINSPTSEPGE